MSSPEFLWDVTEVIGFLSAQEVTESKNAKDVFCGRLLPDMVAEKLGHSKYSDVRVLRMQACSIR